MGTVDKLYQNEFVVSSLPKTVIDGRVIQLLVTTSFGRLFEYDLCSNQWRLWNEELAS